MAILVVEDDDEVRGLLDRLLRSEGYRVLAYPDAGPALDEVDFDQVELVLTDLQMPTPGDWFILELRRTGVDVPVLVLTGDGPQGRACILETLGVGRIMTKPFQVDELIDAVTQML